MKRYTTLVTARLDPQALARLEERCDLRFAGWVTTGDIASTQELLPHLNGVEIWVDGYEKITEELLLRLPELRMIAVCRGNPVNVDLVAAERRGIPVVYTPGRNANGVAEFTMGMMLDITRHFTHSNAALLAGHYLGVCAANPLAQTTGDVIWDTPGESLHTTYGGYELEGRTLGVVGLGAIGRLVAKKAAGLGMKVLACDPYCVDAGGLARLVELDALLTESDVVTLHCKAPGDGRPLLGRRELGMIKPTAVLLNTARAALVDQSALLEILRERRIAGAALDVFWKEPLPCNHPLLELDNVLLTPHIAGASLDVTRIQSAMIAEDVLNWIENKPLLRQAKA